MICNKCGKEIKDGAKFCTFCGAVQEEKAAAPVQVSASSAPTPAPAQWTPASVQNPPAKANEPIFKKWWFWLAIVAVVALICVTIIVSSTSGKNNNDIPFNTTAVAETTSVSGGVTTTLPNNESNGEHDDSYNNYDDGFNYDDDKDYDVTYLKKGETQTVDGLIEITVEKGYWAEELVPSDTSGYSYSYFEDVASEIYFVVEATVSNISSKDLELRKSYLQAVFNGEYTYVETTDVGFDLGNKVDTMHTLTPMSTCKVYFLVSVPDRMKSMAETCDYYIGFDKEFENAYYYGFDVCDYIYCASFTINKD